MALVEKPNPAKKLLQVAVLDGALIMVGVVIFLMTQNVVYLIIALLIGAAISTPLLLQAVRQMKEQD